MKNSINNFMINFKQRLSNSLLLFSQQQIEKVSKDFLDECKNFKFHTYKDFFIILLGLSAIFIIDFNIISLTDKTQSSIVVCSWLFIILTVLELVINSISICFKYITYQSFLNFIKEPTTIEKLIDEFLNKKHKSAIYYRFSSYFKFEDFNAHMSKDEVALLLNLPLNTNQKQYLYELIAQRGISLSDLEYLQSIEVPQPSKQKHLYLVK